MPVLKQHRGEQRGDPNGVQQDHNRCVGLENRRDQRYRGAGWGQQRDVSFKVPRWGGIAV